jgi:phenylalanyl-tRNA synthetase beta subunit
MNITFIIDKIDIKGHYTDSYNFNRNLYLNVDRIEQIDNKMVFINEKIINKYHDILIKLEVENSNWTLSGNFYRQNMTHPLDIVNTVVKLEPHSWKQLNDIINVLGEGKTDFKIYKINTLFNTSIKP